jgi:hypothetical protein
LKREESLSLNDRVLLVVAVSLWNGSGDVTPDALLLGLAPAQLEAVCSLIQACDQGNEAVDRWIEEHDAGR